MCINRVSKKNEGDFSRVHLVTCFDGLSLRPSNRGTTHDPCLRPMPPNAKASLAPIVPTPTNIWEAGQVLHRNREPSQFSFKELMVITDPISNSSFVM